MRVCLLNDSFPPVIDGTVNVMMNYADYMMQDFGAEIAVATPRYPEADYSGYAYKVVPYASIDTASVTNGYRAGYPFEGRSVAELVDFAPDIIHAHCPASALVVARLLREETGAPLVFTYHTKYDIDIKRAVKIPAIAREGIRAMVANIDACDEVWTVSEGAGRSLQALGYQGDFLVMPNGVDFARGRVDAAAVAKATKGYDLPEGVPVFLFVGRMMCYKGIPMILDALKILADSGQDFRMVLIGKGPDREELEQRARELGLLGGNGETPRCIFTGPVYDRDVLRAWNTRADLFLFPSTFDTNGLVVREAAACGLASVLIRDSCAAEGITDGRNGFIIEETPEAMAALLAKACRDTDHLHEVGQCAMDEIYLSWKTCVGMAYARYEEVLDRKQKGLLPDRRKQASDYLVSWTARNMEEEETLRRIRSDVLGGFRESAFGMMENIQESMDQSEHYWNSVAREMRRSTRELGAEIRGGVRHLRDEVKSSSREFGAGIRTGAEELRDGIQMGAEGLRDGIQTGTRELRQGIRTGMDNAADKVRSRMGSGKK